jgi:chitin disaccharide deacetylase
LTKHLIINADDFGASPGINRGVVECHTRGVVTSASLMVDAPAAAEAVQLAAMHGGLSLGLHCELDGLGSLEDEAAVRAEATRQIERFADLVGALPTHVDSHHHVHREPALRPVFDELVGGLGVPLRAQGRVAFIGGFYAQWEHEVTELHYVSVHFLQQLLREEVREGWTELSCHPGYVDPGFRSGYLHEREAEIMTLTDGRVRQTLDELGIELASYRDLPSG